MCLLLGPLSVCPSIWLCCISQQTDTALWGHGRDCRTYLAPCLSLLRGGTHRCHSRICCSNSKDRCEQHKPCNMHIPDPRRSLSPSQACREWSFCIVTTAHGREVKRTKPTKGKKCPTSSTDNLFPRK